MPDDQILAETQTAGFGGANGKVVQRLKARPDPARPALVVVLERESHPDPLHDDSTPETEPLDSLTVEPTSPWDEQKIEIGTSHGRDRVVATTNEHAPRAYVRHERQGDGGWQTQRRWELHPATGIEVSGVAAAGGGRRE